MLFSGIPFLFYFLPCVLLLYFITPGKLKNTVLLLASLFFYGWGEPRYVLWMIAAIVLGYTFGRLMERFQGRAGLRKTMLVLSVVSSLVILGYFKYADFFIENFNAATGLSVPLLRIALPIGISFYTFQILSYTVDVYRGQVGAQRNFIDLAAYVALFPQLIAGPIVRYSDIALQLKNRTHSMENIALGMRRFLVGLSKKILLANVLGELCTVFRDSGEKSVLFCWLYAIAYSLHVYFDFSGYSDMAIGLGRIFGFHFPENFNYPFISASITEFWRRWHISLGSWFRDYVYIPLGGNRVRLRRQLFNILVVWMLTGFWHGAGWQFIMWGALYAVLLIIEKMFAGKFFARIPSFVSHVYVMFFVIIGFVLFNSDGIGGAFYDITAMFGARGLPVITAETVYYLKSFFVMFIIGIIGSTPLIKYISDRLRNGRMRKAYALLYPLILCLIVVLVTAYLVDGSFNPFLYFRF